MAKGSRKVKYGIPSGVIGIIITLGLAAYGNQLFHTPEIVPVEAMQSDSVCPSIFTLPSGSGYFSVQFLNQGDNPGDFDLSLSSPDVLSRVQYSNGPFESQTQKSYNLGSHSNPISYNFELNAATPVNPPSNIEINLKGECSHKVGPMNLSCDSMSFSCKYSRDSSGIYNLFH